MYSLAPFMPFMRLINRFSSVLKVFLQVIEATVSISGKMPSGRLSLMTLAEPSEEIFKSLACSIKTKQKREGKQCRHYKTFTCRKVSCLLINI